MAIIDDRTTNLSLAKPNVDNALQDDVARLREALDSIDTALNGKQGAIGFTPENAANKDASGGYAGLTLFKLNLRNAANTVTSWFTTAATVARTWTLPDKDGTVAMTSDITSADIQEFAATGTYNMPASAKFVMVELWGAGGGGASGRRGAAASLRCGGGAGGGGASLNGTNSGAGGAGGDGFARVYSW